MQTAWSSIRRSQATLGGGCARIQFRRMFECIVCGVDGSEESLEAVRQADVLGSQNGRLVLVAVVDLTDAIHFQIAPTAIHAARHALELADELDRRAHEALERARRETSRTASVTTTETAGGPARCLIETAATEEATVIAVGTHGLGRVRGVALGSVTTRVLHRAPCSVFVARPALDDAWTPAKILVGVDGSPASDAALVAAHDLQARFGATLETSTIEHRHPAHALVEASVDVDLLVVGSRGLHGAHLLGSVTEHVAHEARCSVLVVRSDPV
jgi:nucleotide-binding universal stress UspA family protein